jgi:hypothetical protein
VVITQISPQRRGAAKTAFYLCASTFSAVGLEFWVITHLLSDQYGNNNPIADFAMPGL